MVVFQETGHGSAAEYRGLASAMCCKTDDAGINLLTVSVLCGLSSVLGLIVFPSNRGRVFMCDCRLWERSTLIVFSLHSAGKLLTVKSSDSKTC